MVLWPTQAPGTTQLMSHALYIVCCPISGNHLKKFAASKWVSYDPWYTISFKAVTVLVRYPPFDILADMYTMVYDQIGSVGRNGDESALY